MSHPIVHIELSAENLDELARFYSETFGWDIQAFPEMNYVTFSSGEDSVGGGFASVQEANPAGSTVTYIHSDNLEETLKMVEANGGKKLAPPFDVPGVGRIAMFLDPSGNRMALIKPEMAA